MAVDAAVTHATNAPNRGVVVAVRGSIVDARFEGRLPAIHNLLRCGHGEDIVVEAKTNRIVMVGSLRAEQRCTECHKVQRGEVLGAFTYELLRRKPMAPATAPPKPAG